MEQENGSKTGFDGNARMEITDPVATDSKIIFSAMNGEKIASIDVKTGEVTYTMPEAGKEAAEIFWICFRDRIMELVEESKGSD